MDQETTPSQYQLPPVAIVGVVVSSWGNKGEVKVRSHTDNPRRFSKGSRVLAEGRTLEIERCRWHQGMALIKFRGIDSQKDIEALKGVKLEVPLDLVPAPSTDSYYHFQILDMEVWTREGVLLGTIEDILNTGSNDVYVVKQGEDELLVPAIGDVILEVDIEKGLMVVDLPDGLR